MERIIHGRDDPDSSLAACRLLCAQLDPGPTAKAPLGPGCRGPEQQQLRVSVNQVGRLR